MSSLFVSENNGSSQLPEPTRSKRPRSSLACIRCRKKKVKCDFVQPTCNRCVAAGLPCSYATPPRRVDGHAFDQLGNHVEELKERMQKMQAELALMKHNLHPFSPTPTSSAAAVACTSNDQQLDYENTAMSAPTEMPLTVPPSLSVSPSPGPVVSQQQQQPSVTWKLSLSPSGLRIDTNIASVADLYRILLNGISQLNINTDPSISLFGTPEAIKGVRDKRRRHNDDCDDGGGLLDDYQNSNSSNASTRLSHHGSSNASGGRVWEVDDNEARKISQAKVQLLPKAKMDHLMHTCYHSCFVAYQIVDKTAFTRQYINEELDPLLTNSINAWMSKHGCIYHRVEEGYDPITMGEEYFNNARQLLKKCFDISSPTTIHALLHLYMYQLNSERSNLAYLYIGLAIRMAQDLKYHKKDYMPSDMQQRETNKRLWWSAYWLDLSAALESNRPTMVDDKDCDVDYPTKLDSEDEETGYRLSFCTYSIKLMRIRKDITKHLPVEQSGQSLLSAISRLENALTHWMNDLPPNLRFTDDSIQRFSSTSFGRDAKLILNIQYQTTWIMLHKLFLPKQGQTATPVALLSLNICTKSANTITKMLATQRVSWCHFGFALDGVVASVAIHQLNALSNETDVACLAQRNLIITADMLKNCPLLYMDRINEIIESIQAFLKKNSLPDSLNDIPSVNEDSVNRQSLSSVFHPDEFEASCSSSSSSSRQQQQNDYRPTTTTAGSSSSSSNTHSHHQQLLEIPITVSSGMSSSAASLSPNSSTTASLLTSPVPMAISPQPPTIHVQQATSTTDTTLQQHQHSNNNKPASITLGQDMIDDTNNLLFSSYNALIGFNNLTSAAAATSTTPTTTNVVVNSSVSTPAGIIATSGTADNNNSSMDSLLMGFDTTSETFTQSMFAAAMAPNLFTGTNNNNNNNNNTGGGGGMFATTTTDASLFTAHHHHHQQQQQHAGYPNLMNNSTTATATIPAAAMAINTNTTTTDHPQFFALQQAILRRYPQHYHHSQQGGFDPILFLSQLDPTTAAGLLASASASSLQQPSTSSSASFSNVNSNSMMAATQRQQHTQPDAFGANDTKTTHNDADITAAFLAASRKRMREWDESA